MARRPRLAVALLQILVQRSREYGHRIESFSVDNIARRLARTLIRFSQRLGQNADDGSVQMMPFTHESALTVRGHFARDCHPLYESIPPPGLLALLAQGDHTLSRGTEGLAQSAILLSGAAHPGTS